MKDQDGGHVFPKGIAANVHGSYSGEPGMTLRDYVAVRVLAALLGDWQVSQGVCEGPGYDGGNFAEIVARESYAFADAMLKARGR